MTARRPGRDRLFRKRLELVSRKAARFLVVRYCGVQMKAIGLNCRRVTTSRGRFAKPTIRRDYLWPRSIPPLSAKTRNFDREAVLPNDHALRCKRRQQTSPGPGNTDHLTLIVNRVELHPESSGKRRQLVNSAVVIIEDCFKLEICGSSRFCRQRSFQPSPTISPRSLTPEA